MTELAIAPAALGSGVGAVVGELVDQAVVELPALAELAQREQLLAAAWLMSLRSVRTRRAYCALCRRRHKRHYADVVVMPTWVVGLQVGGVLRVVRSA